MELNIIEKQSETTFLRIFSESLVFVNISNNIVKFIKDIRENNLKHFVLFETTSLSNI